MRVEEDSPVVIDKGYPDRKDRGFQPRAKIQILRYCFAFFPDEKPNIIPTAYSSLSISKLMILIEITVL